MAGSGVSRPPAHAGQVLALPVGAAREVREDRGRGVGDDRQVRAPPVPAIRDRIP